MSLVECSATHPPAAENNRLQPAAAGGRACRKCQNLLRPTTASYAA
ncbi:MAG: hypothetical protein LBG47_05515 [Prevotellaceae bacterium]|nr:hypothetical protein [Prevotellaceae bacterium]